MDFDEGLRQDYLGADHRGFSLTPRATGFGVALVLIIGCILIGIGCLKQ